MGRCCPFLGRQSLNAERVNLSTHQLTEACVNQLVPLQHALAGKIGSDDQRFKVRIVVRSHLDLSARQPSLNQGTNFSSVHKLIENCRAGPGILTRKTDRHALMQAARVMMADLNYGAVQSQPLSPVQRLDLRQPRGFQPCSK